MSISLNFWIDGTREEILGQSISVILGSPMLLFSMPTGRVSIISILLDWPAVKKIKREDYGHLRFLIMAEDPTLLVEGALGRARVLLPMEPEPERHSLPRNCWSNWMNREEVTNYFKGEKVLECARIVGDTAKLTG